LNSLASSVNIIVIKFLPKQWCIMTQHDDIVRLHHMLETAREAVAMIEGKERSHLRRERMLELSVD